MDSHLPDRGEVERAAARIASHIVRTPVLTSEALDRRCGRELFFKCENLQRVAAFKARGAINNLLQLTADQLAAGVVTYSSGNHGQAVAWAAHHVGTRATVCMPIDAPEIKIAGVTSWAAEVVLVGTTSLERQERALQIQEQTGAVVIEPFDHSRTIAGQGTATLEMLAQVADMTGGEPLDALVIPVGGGGLIAGACLAAEDSGTEIFAVEPVGCDSMRQSLTAGKVVSVTPAPTIADGLKPTRVGRLNLEVCRSRLSGAITVDDDQIGAALIDLLTAAKVLVEPSGAAGLAAVLSGTVPAAHRRVGVILSGGNVAPKRLAELLASHGGTGRTT